MPVETPVNAISRAEQLESHPSLVGRDDDKYHLIALKNAYLEMKNAVDSYQRLCNEHITEYLKEKEKWDE